MELYKENLVGLRDQLKIKVSVLNSMLNDQMEGEGGRGHSPLGIPTNIFFLFMATLYSTSIHPIVKDLNTNVRIDQLLK